MEPTCFSGVVGVSRQALRQKTPIGIHLLKCYRHPMDYTDEKNCIGSVG